MIDSSLDVLLVEDSDDDAAFFQRALADGGINVRWQVAHDGVEALAMIFGAGAVCGAAPILKPRLILLDLKLPRVGGIEVLRWLKANPSARAIPVTVLSSSQETCDLAESYALGVNSFVVKPMDFDEFAEMARTMVFYWLNLNRVPC